jgi:hypothetical protein
LLNTGLSGPIDAQGFQNALYMIDIGQNDVNALLSNLPYDQVIAKFPPILAEIKDAVQVKYSFLSFFCIYDFDYYPITHVLLKHKLAT